jgi:class 3 adenylate cyclase
MMPGKAALDIEQDIAILIADLSGYTALTDTHGPGAAADLIETYLEIVQESLTDHCEFHQRVGDEIVIVSPEASCLLSTAVHLLNKCRSRAGFLQIHGGLHRGTILNRNGHFFGTTINLAARIAATAPSGSFYCSEEFIVALRDPSLVQLEARGQFQFKNLGESRLLYELNAEGAKQVCIDPVCRMIIQPGNNNIVHQGEEAVFFCSDDCLQTYLQQVAR